MVRSLLAPVQMKYGEPNICTIRHFILTLERRCLFSVGCRHRFQWTCPLLAAWWLSTSQLCCSVAVLIVPANEMFLCFRAKNNNSNVCVSVPPAWYILPVYIGYVGKTLSLGACTHYLCSWSVTVNCNCNWGTCIAPPTRRPRAHHRVNPYPGARRQNETEMFSDHNETSLCLCIGHKAVTSEAVVFLDIWVLSETETAFLSFEIFDTMHCITESHGGIMLRCHTGVCFPAS